MICPKCGFEQPDGLVDCMRCGVIFSRYRATPASPLPMPPPGAAGAYVVPAAPAPATAASAAPDLPPPGQTLYEGPPPPPPQLYGGPTPPPRTGAPALSGGQSFEIGAILGESLRVYFANFLPFLILSVLAFLPIFVWIAYASTIPLTPQTLLFTTGIAGLLGLFCGPATTAAVTFGVFQQMRGRDTSIVDCLKFGLANLLPVLGVAIVQGLATVVGLALCLIPGFIFMSMYAVAVPAAVEERPGVMGAISRSTSLTQGYRWQIFCVLFLLFALAFGVGVVSGLLSRILFSGARLPTQLFQQALNVVAQGISATASAVMYYRLRSAKESIDVANISSVFD